MVDCTAGSLEGEIHVWWVREAEDRLLEASLTPLLLADEAERAARFRFERHRRQYHLTRALARIVPSLYVAVPPEHWRFERNRFGKPELVDPPLPLRLNLCNTDGLVACAVALRVDVGVDVESTARALESESDLAERYFSRDEVAALRALAETERRERFFRLWTLKESYVKARGSGLALPLDRMSLTWTGSGEVGVVFAPGEGEDPSDWQLHTFELPPSHVLGLAVRHRGAGPLRVRVRPLPLRDLLRDRT